MAYSVLLCDARLVLWMISLLVVVHLRWVARKLFGIEIRSPGSGLPHLRAAAGDRSPGGFAHWVGLH